MTIPSPGSVAKAVTYAQRAITVAKADAPDADRTRKLSAGVAHSTLGYAYMKQDKTAAAIPELKSACRAAQRGWMTSNMRSRFTAWAMPMPN